ncbi:MAG: hypothetical protein SVR81_04495, partial [Chloroflexota bacterium]|nr:hypothetical protein [Chloroflexota bacterium]
INGTHKNRDGDGDRACAAYLAALIRGEQSSPEIYLNRVGASNRRPGFPIWRCEVYPSAGF